MEARGPVWSILISFLAFGLVILWIADYNAVSSPMVMVAWASVPIAVLVMRWFRLDLQRQVYGSALVGIGIGIFSLLTGIYNNFTDEPYAFPVEQHMLFTGVDPYAVLHTAGNATGYLWELPLTTVFVVPGLYYGILMFVCWMVMVWMLRSHRAGPFLAQPIVALIAVNGYSDALPMLLLTISLVGGLTGWGKRLVDALALGFKQFVNVIMFVRHLFRREWGNALLTATITIGWLAPFLLWSPHAVWCTAITLESAPGCIPPSGHPGVGSFLTLNYPIWFVFAVAFWWPWTPERMYRMARRLLEPTRWTGGYIRYAIIGASSLAVNLGAFAIAWHFIPGSLILDGTLSSILAGAWAFAWNYRYTFGLTHVHAWFIHLALFALIAAGVIAWSDGVLWEGSRFVSPLIAQFSGVVTGSVIGYGLNRKFNFEERCQ